VNAEMDAHRVMYDSRPSLEINRGGVTEEDAAFLYGLTLALRPVCIAEVGTGWMRSLRAFCEAADWLQMNLGWPCVVWSCDVNIVAVDSAKAAFPQARLVHGNSTALMKAIVPSTELVFIDGSHAIDDVRQDYDALQVVSTEHTVFVFHDTNLYPDIADFVLSLGGILLASPRGMGIVSGSPLKG